MRIPILILLCCVFLGGCVSISDQERLEYRQLKRRLAFLELPVIKEKDPAQTGFLNLMPGVGNAYLDQAQALRTNFFLWPISCLWSIPQVMIDSSRINKIKTLSFYESETGRQLIETRSLRANLVYPYPH
jgi:hypothetical protein